MLSQLDHDHGAAVKIFTIMSGALVFLIGCGAWLVIVGDLAKRGETNFARILLGLAVADVVAMGVLGIIFQMLSS